jgi:hypothetical protein
METIFKVNQFMSTSLADEISILCARSNGASIKDKLFMDDFISYIRCNQMRYPSLYGGMDIAILNDSHVIISKGDEPMIEIMEAEIFECPTLNHNNIPSAN